MKNAHMTETERDHYRSAVATIAESRVARSDFRAQLVESTRAYHYAVKRRDEFLQTIARMPVDMEQMHKSVFLQTFDDAIKLATADVRKWERLLNPHENDGSIDAAKRVPIEELYQWERMVNGTNQLKAVCPFHDEKTPSFVVYKKENRWHCFGGCARGGDAIDFVRLRDNCSLGMAIKTLTNQ